ncbi:MAG: transketolase [Candidatus Roizmanbacteria bacterium]|nr:MAG: transketolase [Candidatus Roizmanbacteria bacterium]
MNSKIKDLCKLLRYDVITSTTAAGSGHPTTCLSAIELMGTLFFKGFFHFDPDHHESILNDRIIFSKGHAAPLLYALYHAAGLISQDDILSLRKFDSVFEGHPTPRFKYVDVSTGSLGQGLSIGVGMALGIKTKIQMSNVKIKREPKVWVLIGDSEIAEGQVWEAMEIASHYKLNNLVAILDVNRLGQRGETMLGWDLKTYEKRAQAFGWETIVIKDGHDIEEIKNAYHHVDERPTTNAKPTMIIAKTIKGKGVSFLENKDNWHGKPVPKDRLEEALKELSKVNLKVRGTVTKPKLVKGLELRVLGKTQNSQPSTINYKPGAMVATREAYGDALVTLGEKNPNLVVLDAETSNSTYADKFKNNFPERYFEMYIAEQNMISVALGFSKLGFIPFISSFAAFLTRSFDQIRMAQYSNGNVKICGSHAGVSIGSDGPSQMALEDISMMRSILESTVFYPSDAVSAYNLVYQSMSTSSLTYIRTTREKTPILYSSQEKFTVGGSKILKQSKNDDAVIFTAGITVHESLKAYEELKKEGINVCVVDLYSIKPIDSLTIHNLVGTGRDLSLPKINNVIVVEDHYPYGGLGEAVMSQIKDLTSKISFTHLAVNKIPRSGTPEELLAYEKINAAAIVKICKGVLQYAPTSLKKTVTAKEQLTA